ncbi:MAG: N-acetylmuramoyl-L-alanine amidase [Acutalibacteraceae bacterium]
MSRANFAVIRLTRVLTMISTLVVLGVTVYAAYLAVDNTLLSKSANASAGEALPLIIIDPGHGGEDGGALSRTGIVEKDINLAVSVCTEQFFSFFGFDTLMTRSSDELIYDDGCSNIREKKVSDIHNRMKIIEENPVSVFLSIHQNHFENSKYNGAQVFYSKNNEKSPILAQCIQDVIRNDIQPDNDRKIKPTGTEIYLLYHSKVPSVMVECGFLSNAQEADKLNDGEYQKKMAFEIFKGTYDYFVRNGG